MVSITLLHRGLIYFTQMGTNFLPLFKHGMDLYYAKLWSGQSCQNQIFPLVCLDTLGSTWQLTSELGCASVIALLTTILVGIHTALAVNFLLCTCYGKNEQYLAGAEEGCCGAAAVVLSVATFDQDVLAHRKKSKNWRRLIRFITGGFQIAIIVAVCIAIRIVSTDGAYDQQRSSLFVLLPCLMLNITSMVENLWEGVAGIWEEAEKKDCLWTESESPSRKTIHPILILDNTDDSCISNPGSSIRTEIIPRRPEVPESLLVQNTQNETLDILTSPIITLDTSIIPNTTTSEVLSTPVTSNSPPLLKNHTNNTNTAIQSKVKPSPAPRNNYARVECSAAVVSSPPSSIGASSILKSDKDQYMLSKCSLKEKFVVIRLCDEIWIDEIRLGNFELFSSGFKDFKIYLREEAVKSEEIWHEIGQFTAKPTHVLQSFKIVNPKIWSRYVRIEFLTHYGNEYYCPLSIVTVYGKNWVEDLLLGDEDVEVEEKMDVKVTVTTATAEPKTEVKEDVAAKDKEFGIKPISLNPIVVAPMINEKEKRIESLNVPKISLKENLLEQSVGQELTLWDRNVVIKEEKVENGWKVVCFREFMGELGTGTVQGLASENVEEILKNDGTSAQESEMDSSGPVIETIQTLGIPVLPISTPHVKSQPLSSNESILKTITKRIMALERNATLSYSYLDEQSKGLAVLFDGYDKSILKLTDKLAKTKAMMETERGKVRKLEDIVSRLEEILEREVDRAMKNDEKVASMKDQITRIQIFAFTLLLWIILTSSFCAPLVATVYPIVQSFLQLFIPAAVLVPLMWMFPSSTPEPATPTDKHTNPFFTPLPRRPMMFGALGKEEDLEEMPQSPTLASRRRRRKGKQLSTSFLRLDEIKKETNMTEARSEPNLADDLTAGGGDWLTVSSKSARRKSRSPVKRNIAINYGETTEKAFEKTENTIIVDLVLQNKEQ